MRIGATRSNLRQVVEKQVAELLGPRADGSGSKFDPRLSGEPRQPLLGDAIAR